MGDNYIMIEGTKVQLSDETVKEFKEKFGIKKSIFDRVSNDTYYCVSREGKITEFRDCSYEEDVELFEYGNYCTDKSFLKKRAKQRHLMNRMERFSWNNGGDKIDWGNENQYKFIIRYDRVRKEFEISKFRYTSSLEIVYFASKEVARKAIEKFGDEIIEYLGGM